MDVRQDVPSPLKSKLSFSKVQGCQNPVLQGRNSTVFSDLPCRRLLHLDSPWWKPKPGPSRTGLRHLWSTWIDFAHLSSLITSTKWASLFSLKFLARRWIRAEWSIPVPAVPVPPARPKLVLVPVLVLVFLSFSWRISHRELWLALTGSSTGGLRRPLAVLYLRPGMS